MNPTVDHNTLTRFVKTHYLFCHSREEYACLDLMFYQHIDHDFDKPHPWV